MIRDYIEHHCPLLAKEIVRRTDAGRFDITANVVTEVRCVVEDILGKKMQASDETTKGLGDAEERLTELVDR